MDAILTLLRLWYLIPGSSICMDSFFTCTWVSTSCRDLPLCQGALLIFIGLWNWRSGLSSVDLLLTIVELWQSTLGYWDNSSTFHPLEGTSIFFYLTKKEKERNGRIAGVIPWKVRKTRFQIPTLLSNTIWDVIIRWKNKSITWGLEGTNQNVIT